MKKNILKLLALFMVLIALSTSCNPEEKYPKDVSFTEYSIEETSCQWVNLPYDNKVIIINSAEELKKYLTGKVSDFPAIDFSKQSLLLASRNSSNGVLSFTITDLQQHSSNKYSLNIEITLSDTTANKTWCKAIIVKKMSENNEVILNITFKEQEIAYPIDIPFEDYSLEGTSCEWVRLKGRPYDFELVSINSNEELEKYIECTDESNFPAIDFSRYTLLLARGIESSGSSVPNHNSLQQLSKQHYKMEAEIFVGNAAYISYWQVPIIVRKMTKEDIIELIVTRICV